MSRSSVPPPARVSTKLTDEQKAAIRAAFQSVDWAKSILGRDVWMAWNQLDPAERGDCGIFAQDYGQAGAIDFFGRRYGLPRSLSGDKTFFLWGPSGYSGKCLIVLDDTRENLEQIFQQVDYIGTSADNPWALEKNIDVFICRGPKFGTLAELWPKLKKWR